MKGNSLEQLGTFQHFDIVCCCNQICATGGKDQVTLEDLSEGICKPKLNLHKKTGEIFKNRVKTGKFTHLCINASCTILNEL